MVTSLVDRQEPAEREAAEVAALEEFRTAAFGRWGLCAQERPRNEGGVRERARAR